MKFYRLLSSLFCFSSSVLSAVSQYPCVNTVYYARSLAGENEFLLCHTPTHALSVLYGSIKEYTPKIDITLEEEDLQIVAQEQGCEISLPLFPYRLVLTVTPEHENTLVIYHPSQVALHVPLNNITHIQYLHELRGVKEQCEIF